jgi:hypothetical protein
MSPDANCTEPRLPFRINGAITPSFTVIGRPVHDWEARRARASRRHPDPARRGMAVTGTHRASKTCVSCGRAIEWRKKWERNWETVRYCSSACRRRGVRTIDLELDLAITTLLDQRAGGATICPSEAARLVANRNGLEDDQWRDLMEPARAAARRLVAAGEVEIVQQGHVVDPSTAKGAIRIRRRGPGDTKPHRASSFGRE